MKEQPFPWPDVTVMGDYFLVWLEDLGRFVTGIENAAAGHGDRVDAERLLTDFAEARDRSLTRLLASCQEPSPEAWEREDAASPHMTLPSEVLYGSTAGFGLIRALDEDAAGEGQGDPEQVLRDLTVALDNFEQGADRGAPASFAAASLMMIPGGGSRPARKDEMYRCLLKRPGPGKAVFCCQPIMAPNQPCAHKKQVEIGRNHRPILIPAKLPSLTIRCGKRRRCVKRGRVHC
jgi:hypothetical protein